MVRGGLFLLCHLLFLTPVIAGVDPGVRGIGWLATPILAPFFFMAIECFLVDQ